MTERQRFRQVEVNPRTSDTGLNSYLARLRETVNSIVVALPRLMPLVESSTVEAGVGVLVPTLPQVKKLTGESIPGGARLTWTVKDGALPDFAEILRGESKNINSASRIAVTQAPGFDDIHWLMSLQPYYFVRLWKDGAPGPASAAILVLPRPAALGTDVDASEAPAETPIGSGGITIGDLEGDHTSVNGGLDPDGNFIGGFVQNGGGLVPRENVVTGAVRAIDGLTVEGYFQGDEIVTPDVVATANLQNDAVVSRKAATIVSGNRTPAISNSNALTLTGGGAPYGVEVAAFNIQFPDSIDEDPVSYNAGTASGTVPANTPFVVTADDPTKSGGSVSYVVRTNLQEATASDGRIKVGDGKTPTSGGGTGEPPPPLPPEDCVAANAWLTDYIRARDAYVGLVIHGMTDAGEFVPVTVTQVGTPTTGPGRRIRVAGRVVRCSDTTPIVLEDLSWKKAPEIEVGDMMAVRINGVPVWRPVQEVAVVENLEYIRISVSGHSFAANNIYTHNSEQKP